jgi:SPP1 family phage portal protein
MVLKHNKYIARSYYWYSPQKKDNGMFATKFSKVDEWDNENYKSDDDDNEIYINYFKFLVTQKIDYLLLKKPDYDQILDEIGLNFWIIFDKLLLNASLDIVSWIHFYVKDSKLKYIIVYDSEIIPFWNNDKTELEKVVRYYKDDKMKDDPDLIIEVWEKTGVQYFRYSKEGNLISEIQESHYETEYILAGEPIEKEFKSFNEIPFIPFYNNRDKTSDLFDIKNMMDAYNSLCTGFFENIEKFQEFIMLFQGFSGDKEALKEAMKKLKEAKAIGLPDSSSNAGYISVDIPVEARNVLLEVLKEALFFVGRGMDPTKVGDGNVTNVVIKSRYILLDSKSSESEKRVVEFYNKCINFIKAYYRNNVKNNLTLNKSMLINESEKIDDCLKSMDMTSLKTVMDNHPWVKNSDDEIKLIEEERKQNLINLNKDDSNNNNFNNNNNNNTQQ